MSTDLNSRSKAYDLTRTSTRGEMAVVVGQGWNKPAVTLTVSSIEHMFANDDFGHVVAALELLDETVDRLKLDLAQFALTKGNGMEAIDA